MKNKTFNRGICIRCGLKPQVLKGVCKKGKNKGRKFYKNICYKCTGRKIKTPIYRKYKKDSCEQCGFIPMHKCQLDVDHIDNNHFNNDVDNLRTLCANCHRLKTHLARK